VVNTDLNDIYDYIAVNLQGTTFTKCLMGTFTSASELWECDSCPEGYYTGATSSSSTDILIASIGNVACSNKVPAGFIGATSSPQGPARLSSNPTPEGYTLTREANLNSNNRFKTKTQHEAEGLFTNKGWLQNGIATLIQAEGFIACAAGKYSLTGAASCTDITAGYYAVKSPSGGVAPYYASGTATTTAAAGMVQVPAGYYPVDASNNLASTKATAILPCDKGYFS